METELEKQAKAEVDRDLQRPGNVREVIRARKERRLDYVRRQHLAKTDNGEAGDLARASLAAERAERARKRGSRMEQLAASLKLGELRARVAKILGLAGSTTTPASAVAPATTAATESAPSPAEVRAKIEALTEGDPTILLRFVGTVKAHDPAMDIIKRLDTGSPEEQAEAAKTLAALIEQATAAPAKPAQSFTAKAPPKPIAAPAQPPPQVPRPNATTTPVAPKAMTPDEVEAGVTKLLASGDVNAIVAFNRHLTKLAPRGFSIHEIKRPSRRVEAAKVVERALALTSESQAKSAKRGKGPLGKAPETYSLDGLTGRALTEASFARELGLPMSVDHAALQREALKKAKSAALSLTAEQVEQLRAAGIKLS